MKTESEIDEIKQKLFDKLEPNGWGRVFKSFIFSSEFTEILSKLYQLSIADKRFTPTLKQLFRAFEECPYDDLKVVFIGQDPYPILLQYHMHYMFCQRQRHFHQLHIPIS